MCYDHLATRASQALGAPVRFECDRTHARCRLVNDQGTVIIGLPEASALDLDLQLLDLDSHHRGLLLELNETSVRHEPNFDLMLEGAGRIRYVVLPDGDHGWALWPADEARSVAEVVDSVEGPAG